jgi:hypothetical protein
LINPNKTLQQITTKYTKTIQSERESVSEMNYNRLISGGGRLLRRLCTEATVAEIPKRKPGLYQKLAELEKTGGTVSQTLNQYIMEGKAVGKGELEICVEELRKYRRFNHAFEVSKFFINFFP